jgi:8-oxo-dGTP pyrophosphatase MutT (NUDIX family)
MASRQGIGERLAEAAFARVSGGPGRRLLLAFLGTRPGGWALALAHRVLPARQPIGVLAVVLDGEGRVLLLDHVTRPEHALGLPGGWLARAERPEDGLRRELHEETGLQVTDAHYLLSAPHAHGAGRPYGLTLVFHATIASDALAETSAEIRHASWLPVAEALTHLRDFEAAAVRLAAGAER